MIANHERRKTCCINNKLYFITTIMTCAYLYCNYCHNNHHLPTATFSLYLIKSEWKLFVLLCTNCPPICHRKPMHFDLTNVIMWHCQY